MADYIRRISIMPSLGNLPQPRSSAQLTQNGNNIVVFGGVGRNDVLSDLHYFDVTTRKWTEAHPTNTPLARGGSAHCTYGGKWFMFSGRSLSKYCVDVVVFDFSTLQWSTVSPQSVDGFFPSPRDDAGYCLWRDELLIFGGVSEDGSLMRDLWSLHLPTATWSCPRVTGTTPNATAALTVALWEREDSLVTFGGFDGINFTAEVHILHLPSATWTLVDTSKPHQPRPRTHAAGFIKDRYYFICGGYAGTSPLADCWCLDMYTWMWTAVTMPTAVVPRGASGGMFFHATPECPNDMIILFGGCTGGDFLNDMIAIEFGDASGGTTNTTLNVSQATSTWNAQRPPRLVIPHVGSESPRREQLFSQQQQPPLSPLLQPPSPLRGNGDSTSNAMMTMELQNLQKAVEGLRSEVLMARSASPRLSQQQQSVSRPRIDNEVADLRFQLENLMLEKKRYEGQQGEYLENRKALAETRAEVEMLRGEVLRLQNENGKLLVENQRLNTETHQGGASATKLRRASETALKTMIDMQIELDMVKRELNDIRLATQIIPIN